MKKHIQVTINREFGSGGRLVGEALAERINAKLVDKLILEEAAKAMKMSPKYLKQFEEKAPSIWESFNFTGASFHGMSIPMHYIKATNTDLYVMQAGLMKQLALENTCIFVGRCANYILKDHAECVRIFLYADMPTRVSNIIDKYGFKKEKNTEKEILKIDKQRSEYYRTYTSEQWRDMKQYDLCIDTSKLSIDEVVDIICQYIEKRKRK